MSNLIHQFKSIRWKNDPPKGNLAYEPTQVEHIANILTHGVSVLRLFGSFSASLTVYFPSAIPLACDTVLLPWLDRSLEPQEPRQSVGVRGLWVCFDRPFLHLHPLPHCLLYAGSVLPKASPAQMRQGHDLHLHRWQLHSMVDLKKATWRWMGYLLPLGNLALCFHRHPIPTAVPWEVQAARDHILRHDWPIAISSHLGNGKDWTKWSNFSSEHFWKYLYQV